MRDYRYALRVQVGEGRGMSGMSDATCCRLFGLPECCEGSLTVVKRYYTTSYVPLDSSYGIGSCSCCNPARGPVDYRCCSIYCL